MEITGKHLIILRSIKRKRFIHLFSNNKYYLIGIFAIAIFYISLILLYTRGSLLFNGDHVGFYHLSKNLFTTPNGILEGVSLFLSYHNFYVAFYLFTFFSMIVALTSAFYFSTQTLKYFLPRKLVKIAALISSFFYVITPYVLVDYYNTFLGNISITSSFFTLFLGFMIGSYEFYQTNRNKFSLMLLSGAVSLGLSVTLFPNDIRTLLVGGIIFLAFIIFIVLKTILVKQKVPILNIVISIAIFLSVATVSSLFITFSMFINIGSQLNTASVASTNFSNLAFYTGSFNTIPWVIRLLGQWSFPTGFVSYNMIYFRLDIVNIASFFWPILALFVPLIFAYRRMKNRFFLIFLMFLVICSIFWEKGGNPPFGFIWYYINSRLPFGYELIPTGTLTKEFLSKIYPVFVTLSIFLIFDYMKRLMKYSKLTVIKKIGVIIIPIFLASMLVIAEAPVFDGQLEINSANSSKGGFFIPQEYSVVRNYVLKHPGNILILPGATTYVTFSWNYSGSSFFYNQFFNPVKVTTNQNYGGSYGSVKEINAYINITSPIKLENGTIILSTQWMQEMYADNYTYVLFDRSIIGGSLYENYTYTNAAINYLVNYHVIDLIYSKGFLNLYKISYGFNYSKMVE